MLLLAGHRLALAQLFALGVAAHRDWWLEELPNCWQSCLGSTGDGCSSRNCICKTTEDSASYLPSAVSCTVSQCDTEEWALEFVLGPLQLYCAAIDCPIPDEVLSSAYAAATDTEEGQPHTTREAQSSIATNEPGHKTTTESEGGDELTSTVKTTFTKTTTDDDGNTLQVIVSIVVGPTGISTGDIVTSTVDGRVSSTTAPSSTPALPSSTAADPSPASTKGAPSTSEAGSEETRRPANGDGSPFENMQAGAGRWSVSTLLLGLGVLVVLFIRL